MTEKELMLLLSNFKDYADMVNQKKENLDREDLVILNQNIRATYNQIVELIEKAIDNEARKNITGQC